MNDLYDLEKPENPVCDLMGNEILRGHVIAYSKAGQGSRSMYVGVVTAITPFGNGKNKKYSHAVFTVSSNGWWGWGGEHRAKAGVNDSIVILNDPLFSLNSDRISKLFEKIDQVRGKNHGDIFIIQNPYDPNRNWHKELTWKSILPADYEYGNPIDEEQLISVPNKKEIQKLNRQLKKKRAEKNGKAQT